MAKGLEHPVICHSQLLPVLGGGGCAAEWVEGRKRPLEQPNFKWVGGRIWREGERGSPRKWEKKDRVCSSLDSCQGRVSEADAVHITVLLPLGVHT